jgi:hypothetical protein
MSEPMTNIEIEDVLSSIRRLVSEDVTKAKARPALLMLTPALRVAGSEESRTDPAAPADAAQDREEAPSETPASDRVMPVSVDPAPEADPPDSAPSDSAPSDERAAEAGATGAAEISLEERIADLEAAIGQSEEEFEPDGSEDLSAHIPDEVLRPAFGSAQPEAWDLQPEPPVSNLPAGSADASDEPEAASGADAGDEAEGPENLVEEALIDEDSLREIVAALVRQELRGELGERITRNVRRLVRREINRALALQDLDEDDD